ncbi:MAG: PIN domain-containing protein [Candidatus Micrarchaeales archaeon]
MKSVIIDTSSILFGLANKVDPFQSIKESFPSYKIVVSSGIIKELAVISGSRKKEKVQAKIGLALMKKHEVEVVKGDEYVDRWIIKHSGGFDTVVCTNDVVLKQKLKAIGARVVSVAQSGMLR